MINITDTRSYRSLKVISYPKAITLIAHLRKANKTVGLCHGGFDLLHPGHIKHFESAKKLCDILIVSVTSDRFVTSRKGPGRPIFSDKLRAYMIANLLYVDYVVISDFKTGVEVINLLKPSYYIKGPDFINKTTPGIIAERQAIKNVGGETKCTNDSKLSNTEIVEYIKTQVITTKILVGIDRDGTIILNDDFFGKNSDWQEELKLNENVINFLIYLQTKYKTTKIVISNQSGVARGYFDENRVNEVNQYLNSLLIKKGIKIDNWQFCPDVDSEYATKHPELKLQKKFIKNKTHRKPATEMTFKGVKALHKKILDFDQILIIGDRDEDKQLAQNLKVHYLDIKNKTYNDLVKEFEKLKLS